MWMIEKPKDVMEFSYIREKFLQNIHQELDSPYAVLKFKIPVEDI